MDDVKTSELAGPERPVSENTIGFRSIMGLDDKAVAKGVQRNDEYSNIKAFSDVLRSRDQDYYSEMPINTNDTDPSNTIVDKSKIDDLRSVLQKRVLNVKNSLNELPIEKQNENQEQATEPVSSSAAKPSMSRLQAVWHDLKNWNSLPAQPGWKRVHYVATRDNRLVWLIIFVIIMMIIGYLVNAAIKKKNK